MSEISESFFQLMENHSSVRSFRAQAVIPAEHERRIVSAAQRSSTSCNLQTYAFLSIKDPGTRDALAEVCGGQRFIREAGLFFVVCVDLHKMEIVTSRAGYEYYQARYLESFLMSAMDAAIAAQTAALAAEALGYGICLVGSIRNHSDRAIQILQLPPRLFPLVGLCVGVPLRENQPNQPRPRLPLEGVLFQERYDPDRVEAAIRSYDRTMEQTGCYCGREFSLQEVAVAAGETRREDSRPAGPGGYGWIEHSARRVCSRNPEHARPNLSAVLRQAGFGLE